jgi:hypothetical protein
MNFTFGIITCERSNEYIHKIVESIKKLNIPNYEIIIVGKSNFKDKDFVKTIEFDESIKNGWITKKKNIITENAKYDNIVYTHDYHVFDDNWYEGYLKFGDNFKVCSNVILNAGFRYRDWLWFESEEIPKHSLPNHEHLLPYFETRCSKWMYINGSYWVAKKHVMQEFPLHENLCQNESEDIEWSKRVSSKYNFSINTNSSVTMLKYHCPHWNLMSNDTYHNYIVPFLKSKGL